MTMSSIESYSCFLSSILVKIVEHAILRHNSNGKYVKIYYTRRVSRYENEQKIETFGRDFIIYDTLMLQLEAHKINDSVLFNFCTSVPSLQLFHAIDGGVQIRNVNFRKAARQDKQIKIHFESETRVFYIKPCLSPASTSSIINVYIYGNLWLEEDANV